MKAKPTSDENDELFGKDSMNQSVYDNNNSRIQSKRLTRKASMLKSQAKSMDQSGLVRRMNSD